MPSVCGRIFGKAARHQYLFLRKTLDVKYRFYFFDIGTRKKVIQV